MEWELRIEAPDANAAKCLLDEARGLFDADALDLADGRWEVHIRSGRERNWVVAEALNAVERMLAICEVAETQVHLDGCAYTITAGAWVPPPAGRSLPATETG